MTTDPATIDGTVGTVGTEAPEGASVPRARVARNLLTTVITQLLSWVLTFTVTLYLPRYLGVQGMGKLAFAIALVTICGVVVPLGTSTVLVREIARDRDRTGPLLGAALSLRIPLGLLTSGVLLLTVWLLGYDGPTRLLLLCLAAAMTVGATGEALGAALQGQERLPRHNAAMLAERFLNTGLTLAMIFVRAPLWAFGAVTLAAAFVSLALNAAAFRGLASELKSVGFRPDGVEVRRLALAGLPFLGWIAFTTLYGQIDPVVLSLLTDDKTVGWYAVAFRLIGSSMFFPSAVTTALLPTLSRLHAAGDHEAFRNWGRRMLTLVMLCGVPIALVLFCVPGRVMEILRYPAEYAPSADVLRIGGIGVFLWFAGNVLGTCVIASDGQKEMCRTAMFAAILGVPLCVAGTILGDRLFGNGAAGAMASHVLLEALLVYRYLRLLPAGFFGTESASVLGRFALASVPMAALLGLTGTRLSAGAWQVAGLLVASVALYAAFCVLLRCLDPRQVLALARAAGSRGSGA